MRGKSAKRRRARRAGRQQREMLGLPVATPTVVENARGRPGSPNATRSHARSIALSSIWAARAEGDRGWRAEIARSASRGGRTGRPAAPGRWAPPSPCPGASAPPASGSGDLARRIGAAKDRRRALGQRLPGDQSACTAFKTSATWPGTLTLCQTWRTTPSLSMRKVARSIPMYLRPYMLFSTHTP